MHNAWETRTGKFFYEVDGEQDDHAIVGDVHRYTTDTHGLPVGEFRIEPDGRISSFPELPFAVCPELMIGLAPPTSTLPKGLPQPHQLVAMARGASYNYEAKQAFKKAAMRWARTIAKALQLPKGTFEVRFNPGGIAVSGDLTLHHEKFYLSLSDFGAYWRTCKGLKDYGSTSSGPNQPICTFVSSTLDNSKLLNVLSVFSI